MARALGAGSLIGRGAGELVAFDGAGELLGAASSAASVRGSARTPRGAEGSGENPGVDTGVPGAGALYGVGPTYVVTCAGGALGSGDDNITSGPLYGGGVTALIPTGVARALTAAPGVTGRVACTRGVSMRGGRGEGVARSPLWRRRSMVDR